MSDLAEGLKQGHALRRETGIDHTPKRRRRSTSTSHAYDVVAEHKQTDYKHDTHTCGNEFEVTAAQPQRFARPCK